MSDKHTYEYIEPKTPQEADETKRRLQRAYDILFEETQKRRAAQKSS